MWSVLIPRQLRFVVSFRAELEQQGQPLDLADLGTASIALAGDFTLVTGNTRHFGRIEGLRVENWLKG